MTIPLVADKGTCEEFMMMFSSKAENRRLSKLHWKRRRLVDALLTGAPLTIVRGPSGCGKTSLLNELVVSLEEDATSEEPKIVFVVGQAMEALKEGEVWEQFARELIVEENEKDERPVQEQIFRFLAANREPVSLIIDDSSFLTRSDAEFILHLLRTFRHFSVLAASQVRSELESTRIRLTCDVEVLAEEDLNFTAHEVGEYLRFHLPEVYDSTIETIFAHVQGNTTLTKAALQYLLAAATPNEMGVVEAMVEHLRDVVPSDLEALHSDPNLLDFVVKTSVADSVPQAFARQITGRRDVAELFRQAEEAGLGSWDKHSPTTFTYSVLVREDLAALRHNTLTERVISGLVKEAVSTLQQLGDPLNALRTALKNQRYVLANQVLLENTEAVLGAAIWRVSALIPWIPEAVADHHPELGCLAAVGHTFDLQRRSHASNLWHRSAMAARSLRDCSDPLRSGLLYATEGIALRRNARPEQALEAARKSEELLKLAVSNDSEGFTSGADFAAISNAATMIAAGAFEAAISPLLRVLEHGTTAPMRCYASAHLAAAAALDGDLTLAENAIDGVVFGPVFAEDGSILAETAAFLVDIYEVVRALEAFDMTAADDRLVSLLSRPNADEYWSLLAALHAFRDLLADESYEGLARLESTSHRYSTESLTSRSRAVLDYYGQLLRGAKGENLALEQYRETLDMRKTSAAELLAYARGLFHAGKFVPALRILAKIRGRQDATIRLKVEALTLEAAALLRHDCDADLTDVLGLLVAQLGEYGLRLPLALLADEDVRRLIEADARLGRGELRDFYGQVHARPLQLEVVAPLTGREKQILERLAKDETLAEVGERLLISENTVRTHVKSIHKKLGVSKRQDALVVAGLRGLLEDA